MSNFGRTKNLKCLRNERNISVENYATIQEASSGPYFLLCIVKKDVKKAEKEVEKLFLTRE